MRHRRKPYRHPLAVFAAGRWLRQPARPKDASAGAGIAAVFHDVGVSYFALFSTVSAPLRAMLPGIRPKLLLDLQDLETRIGAAALQDAWHEARILAQEHDLSLRKLELLRRILHL